jgi:hypothetical protein
MRFRANSLSTGAAILALACYMGGCQSGEEGGRSGDLWEISVEPAVVIGSLESSPEASLLGVVGAVRLSDGRMIVASSRSSQLTVFSAEGDPLNAIGGAGDGPGEFRLITSLQGGPDDSLFVFDGGAQRLTVLSGDGRRARTATFRITSGDGLTSVMRLTDGIWVGKEHESIQGGQPYEIVRDTIAIGLLDATLAGFQALEHLPARMSTTGLDAGRRAWRSPAFTPEVVHATWGRCVFMSTAESRSISVFSSEGDRLATFQGPGTPRSITEADVESWIAHNLRIVSVPDDEEASARRFLEDLARPTHLPYYRQMIVDQWGHLWLQEYSPPDGRGRRWYVVSQAGEHLADVVLPKRMTVYAITEHGVLGRTRGALDEEMVELLPLIRRPPHAASPLTGCAGSSE